MKHIVDLFNDAIILKAFVSTCLGFILSMAGLTAEEVDLYLGIFLKTCGLLAFFATFVVTLPRIAELISKILKAIRTTFDK